MIRTLFFVLAVSVFAVSVFIPVVANGADPACPLGEDWAYIAAESDEFNGNSLDPQKWLDFNPTFYGRQPGLFARDNVAVKDGCLRLTARVIRPDELTVENKARGFDQFATSIVKSKKRTLYGYFEARCKSMKANVCNAFWLYDPLNPPEKYTHGNFSEEIDIFELFGKSGTEAQHRVYNATVHRMCTPYVEAIANRKQWPLPKKESKLRVPFDFSAEFHLYGFLWTPQKMVWYIDGKEVFSRDNDYFTKPLHIMFDCEIMKGWNGLPDPKDLPAVFEIDYLRVWKRGTMNIPDAPL